MRPLLRLGGGKSLSSRGGQRGKWREARLHAAPVTSITKGSAIDSNALDERASPRAERTQSTRSSARRFARSPAKRSMPFQIESGSMCASFFSSSTLPPVRQRSSQSELMA
jgi:hypothetical protein